MLHNIAYYFSVLFVLNSLVHLWSFFNTKKIRNFIFFTSLLLCGVGYWYGAMFYSGDLLSYPVVYGFAVPVEVSIICLCYFLVVYTPNFEHKPNRKEILFVSLPILISIGSFLVVFYTYSLQEKTRLLEEAFYSRQLEHLEVDLSPLFIGVIMLVVLAIFLFFRPMVNWRKVVSEFNFRVLYSEFTIFSFALIAITVLIWTAYFIFRITNSPQLAYATLIVGTGEFFFVLLIAQTIPFLLKLKLLKRDYEAAPVKKYLKPQSAGLDLNLLQTELNRLIQEKKIHRDEGITLPQLANQLSITRTQLSEFFNGVHNIGFRNFINYHRVQDAKELLIKYPNDNISKIAFEVGFKNLSTFYEAFRSLEKVSPKEYRSFRP